MLRLKEIRNSLDMKQKDVCSSLGIPQNTYSQYENGKREPDNETLLKIANFFNVSIDYLLDNNPPAEKGKGIKIPVLGEVIAGIPVEAIEEILDYEEITPQMASQGEHFALQIKGNSMEPKFSAGDVVIVRKQPDVDTGDIAVVLVNGNDATIKKIKKHPDGMTLVPTNPNYDVMFYTNKEIEELPVLILGKVVELRAKF